MGWRPNPAAIDPNSPDYNPDPMANPGHTHTGDPGFGDLLAANNLSDVPNPVAALENLSGVSKQAARAQKGRGVPVNAGLGAWYDSGAIAAAYTHRIPIFFSIACTDVQFVFRNDYAAPATEATDTLNASTIPINVGFEYPAGTIYRATFEGALTASIIGGGQATTDPLALEITAGSWGYIRTYVNATNYYGNRRTYANGCGGFTTTDLTAPGSTTIADTHFGQTVYGPAAVLGTPLSSPTPSVLIVGDSIAAGQNDGGAGSGQPLIGYNQDYIGLGGGGYIVRALVAANIGCVNIAVPSDEAAGFLLGSNHFLRMTHAGACTSAICQYGVNDIANGASLATIQANLITIWNQLNNRGLRTFQTTITPETTSTDFFVTTANQTIVSSAGNTVRINLNTWLRQGAPMLNGVATTNGTTGALYAGQAGHPLYNVFDAASYAESSLNSGIWKAAILNRSVTDGTATASSATVTAPDLAAVAASDNGRTITITGAGTAGATLQNAISQVNSGTSIGMYSTAVTTVSGTATVSIYDSFTNDGTHPQPYGCTQLQQSIITSELI